LLDGICDEDIYFAKVGRLAVASPSSSRLTSSRHAGQTVTRSGVVAVAMSNITHHTGAATIPPARSQRWFMRSRVDGGVRTRRQPAACLNAHVMMTEDEHTVQNSTTILFGAESLSS
jgi:hypothetical protein